MRETAVMMKVAATTIMITTTVMMMAVRKMMLVIMEMRVIMMVMTRHANAENTCHLKGVRRVVQQTQKATPYVYTWCVISNIYERAIANMDLQHRVEKLMHK